MNNQIYALRGGSWSYDQRYAHCACRYWIEPDLFDDDLGFRVLEPSKNTKSVVRTVRGGSWLDIQGYARLGVRDDGDPDDRDPDLGFRIIKTNTNQ